MVVARPTPHAPCAARSTPRPMRCAPRPMRPVCPMSLTYPMRPMHSMCPMRPMHYAQRVHRAARAVPRSLWYVCRTPCAPWAAHGAPCATRRTPCPDHSAPTAARPRAEPFRLEKPTYFLRELVPRLIRLGTNSSYFYHGFPHRMGCADPTRRGACCLPRAPHATCCAWCMRGAVHAAHLCCVLRTTCRAPCVACPMPCAVRYTLGIVCRTPCTVCPARQVVGGA